MCPGSACHVRQLVSIPPAWFQQLLMLNQTFKLVAAANLDVA
jgi:hypothetical protein